MILAYVKAGGFIKRMKETDGTVRGQIMPMYITGRAKSSIVLAMPHLPVEFRRVEQLPEGVINTAPFKSCRAIKEIVRRKAVPDRDIVSLKIYFARSGGRTIKI